MTQVRETKPPACPLDPTGTTVPSPDRIIELGYAFRAAKTLHSAVELGVFTALARSPRDLEALRGEIGIAERGAQDFFDALVALGLLERDGTGRYRNTAGSAHYLDAAKPSYIGGDLEHLNVRGYPRWHFLTAALRTGAPQADDSAGGYFPTLYADERSFESFTQGMTGATTLAAPAIASGFPWRKYGTMIYIGTAEGCLPVQIADGHPHITGGGFDLPAVQPCFDRYVERHGFSHRLRFYPGDFFHDPLPGADVLVFGRVLHNWDLKTKQMLLKKAYAALPTGGALIVYERLIDDERQASASGLLASLNMLIVTAGGFDFTSAECISWMREAGFHGASQKPLTAELSMIVGFK
jgi:hypothetical protein